MYVGALTSEKSIEILAIVSFPFLEDLSDVVDCSSSSGEEANRDGEHITIDMVVVAHLVLSHLVGHSDGVGHFDDGQVMVLEAPWQVIHLVTETHEGVTGDL